MRVLMRLTKRRNRCGATATVPAWLTDRPRKSILLHPR
jgi:hypothetical protein